MSVRAVLALTLAAFLLSGCGGGSSEEDSTSAAVGAADGRNESVDPSEQEAEHASGSGVPGAGDSASDAKHSQSATVGPSGEEGGSGQKHGQRIAQPKGPREQAPSPAQIASATVADMVLQSPAVVAQGGTPGVLPAAYTCDGKNSWPELRWAGVPPDTAELALFAMSVQPVNEKLFVDWAVAGLDPDLESIETGKLPKGAIVGTNGFGNRDYEICPSGSGEIYMFAVYALPRRLALSKGFDAREARQEVLDVSGNVGLLPAVYARG